MQFFLKRIRDNFSIDLPAYKLTIEAHKTSKRNSFCKCQHRFDSNQISNKTKSKSNHIKFVVSPAKALIPINPSWSY